MKKKLAFVRANSFEGESRLIKEYSVASGIFDSFLILWNREKTKKSKANAYYLNLRAPFGKLSLIFYLPIWFFFCIFHFVKTKPDIIHACDIEGIIPAYIYSTFAKTKLIYDIFDVTVGKFNPKNKTIHFLLILLDKFFIKNSNAVIVPDPERFSQLQFKPSEIQDSFYVIYNSDLMPNDSKEINFRNKKNIRISYVGVMSRKIRGLEHIFKAAKIHRNFSFWVAGYGPDNSYFQKLFAVNKLKNLEFYARVSHQKAKDINQKSDIMISLLDPRFANYQYATSTKVFEAFSLLKPIITTENTASGKLVEKTNWGLVIPYKSESLIKALEQIEKGEVIFKLESKKVKLYCWNKMSEKLTQIYQSI